MKLFIIPIISFLMMGCPSQETNSVSQKVQPDSTASDTVPIVGDSLHGSSIDTASLQGEWMLIAVLPSDTASGHLPVLRFNVGDNSFSGNSGCNQMRGKFRRTGNSLIFLKDIMLTKMACPGYNEKAFIESLLKVDHFRIENGVLELMAEKTVLSTWKRPGTVKGNSI